jgi:hypothetical protein
MQHILEQLRSEDALLSVTTVDGNGLRRVKIQQVGSEMVILGPRDESKFFVPYTGIAWIEKHSH